MVTAYILATTETGKERDVLYNLKNLPEVREAYNVYGDYDLFAKIETDTIDMLNDFMLKKIREIQHISMTTTMIGL